MITDIQVPDGMGGWMAVTVVRPVDGDWQNVVGSSSPTPSAPFRPDSGPVRNIATNMAVLQNGWTPGATGAAAATRHLLHANASEITLGFFARPNPKLYVKASTPLRAWVRRSASSRWEPVTFAGNPEVTLVGHDDAATITPEMAQNFYTDPIPGPWRRGDMIEVLSWGQSAESTMGAQGALDGQWDYGKVTGSPEQVAAASVRDYIMGGTGPRPSVILAPSSQESSWALIGDSNSVNPSASYANIAFRTRRIPHVTNGKHGLSLRDLSGVWWEFQLGEQLKHCDSVHSALLTNDGAGLPGVPNVLIDVWAKAKAAGVKRWVQATKTPSAAIKADGTQVGDPTGTAALNDWLKDGAPLVNGQYAPAGTEGASRATVVTHDGKIIEGTGDHSVGEGWISDTSTVLESSPGMWNPKFNNGGDLNHYYDAAHEAQSKVLIEHLRLMGF